MKQHFCGKENDFTLKNIRDITDGTLCTLKDGTIVTGVPLDHNGIDSIAYQFEYPAQVRIDTQMLQKMGLSPGPWITDFIKRVENVDLVYNINCQFINKILTLGCIGK